MAEEKKYAASASSRRRREMRDRLWPDIQESELWLRQKSQGFTTIPRTMPLIGRIMDRLSEKGLPLSATYLTLWCWVFDEAFVEVRNPKEFAFESGFSGPRAETTWRGRMRYLESLGFIKSKSGIAGDFQYVLILNPLHIIERLYVEREKDDAYNALMGRLIQVGASDLDL